jgi:hypothetical protein
MGAGSGVVIDSDPAQEFRECLLKAEFLTGLGASAATPIARNVRIVSQPDRVFSSRRCFGTATIRSWSCTSTGLRIQPVFWLCVRSCGAVRAELEAHARQFADRRAAALRSPRRVRLLFDAEGHVQIGSEVLPPPDEPNRIGRACIASNAPIPPTQCSTTRPRIARSTPVHLNRPRATDSTTCSSSICAAS